MEWEQMAMLSQSERILTLLSSNFRDEVIEKPGTYSYDTSQLPGLVEIVVKGCDLILPILLQNPRRMSYVLIQVKNDKSLRQTDKKNEQALTVLSPQEKLDDAGCHFIGIWMSLRSKPPNSMFSSLPKDLPQETRRLWR